jgi:hypothetical protein
MGGGFAGAVMSRLSFMVVVVAIACRSDDSRPSTAAAGSAAPVERVDVPQLADATGTLELDSDPIVELTTPLPDHFATQPIFAVDRRQLAPKLLDGLRSRGVPVVRLVVLANRAKRMIAIEMPTVHAEDSSAELPTKHGKLERFTLDIDADVTFQRVAEIAALASGRVEMFTVKRSRPVAPINKPCPPLALALDGKPITPAVILVRGHDNGGLELLISTKHLECADILKQLRTVSNDEITAEVIVKRDSTAVALEQVVWDNDIQDARPHLVGDAPAAAGAAVAVCIPASKLRGHVMHAGHELDMAGLAKGSYCGMIK